MVYASLVKIKPNLAENKDLKKWIQDDVRLARSQQVDFSFEIKRELNFESFASAYASFTQLLSSLPNTVMKESLGLAVRTSKELRLAREVTLIRLLDDSIKSTYIVNPSWVGSKPAKRNLATREFTSDINGAMQSQLFAMLESMRGDGKIVRQFNLKDTQQKAMYKWQHEFFESKNIMSTVEMSKLMKNVLNVARLPWIKLQFKNNGNTCSFSLSTKGGDVLQQGSKDSSPTDSWGWLHKVNEEQYEEIGHIEKQYRLRISDMKLTMIISWAMNPQILLHELAHYIAFCQPSRYKLNRGEKNLSFKQYQELFAGHGSHYMAVFSRLLVDFMYIDEQYLYDSINSAGLNHFPLKSLNAKDIDDAITQYIK